MANERATGATDRKLGDRVRARRLEIGMSQEGLADLLGVTFQQVQKYEKGVNRIAVSRLLDISSALDLSPCRLLEGLSTRRKTERDDDNGIEVALAKPGAVELVRVFASIGDSKVRRRVLDLVRAMASET